MEIAPADLVELTRAKGLLENPGLAAKIINLLGAPIEKGFGLLPVAWSEKVQSAARAALEKALRVAVSSMKNKTGPSSEALHTFAAAFCGAAGGAFGLLALPVELPISTAVMLRSIADIARSEGENLSLPETQLACLEVFALGGPTRKDDAAETGYFFVRAALARAVTEAAEFIAERGIAMEGAPAIVRFITQIASRFGVVVSEKIAAEAVPIIGAAGGATINLIFIGHFQAMARGHFIVRRLERTYGQDLVKITYMGI